MKDIICVDLTILNNDQLKKFCAEYNFSYEPLLNFKQKTYAKVWFTKDGVSVAFTLIEKNAFDIEDFDTVRMFELFLTELSAIKPYQVPVEPVVLDVDIILEKIFKYGKDSITLEEKNFLDNQ
jgi:hypothetical protein